MFTASTKARIIDTLYEKGADGHFIKHSPSDSRTPDKVKESVQAFLDSLKNCLDKGALLQTYWKRVVEIKKDNLIKGNERPVNGVGTKFEERIIERLTMFIGLLKKTYEQTNFDHRTFLYDQYETAFLTLWSVLNEVSNFYLIKVADAGGILHPNGKRVIVKWSLINSNPEKIFLTAITNTLRQVETNNGLEYEQSFSSDFKVNFRRRKFETLSVPEASAYRQRLFLQIGFILKYAKEIQLGLVDFCNEAVERQNPNQNQSIKNNLSRVRLDALNDDLSSKLLSINELRNHLNLTHGEGGDLYNPIETLRERDEFNKNVIDNLFRVILLLLTGKYIQTL